MDTTYEILVHITAPGTVKDDKRYMSIAEGIANFVPTTMARVGDEESETDPEVHAEASFTTDSTVTASLRSDVHTVVETPFPRPDQQQKSEVVDLTKDESQPSSRQQGNITKSDNQRFLQRRQSSNNNPPYKNPVRLSKLTRIDDYLRAIQTPVLARPKTAPEGTSARVLVPWTGRVHKRARSEASLCTMSTSVPNSQGTPTAKKARIDEYMHAGSKSSSQPEVVPAEVVEMNSGFPLNYNPSTQELMDHIRENSKHFGTFSPSEKAPRPPETAAAQDNTITSARLTTSTPQSGIVAGSSFDGMSPETLELLRGLPAAQESLCATPTPKKQRISRPRKATTERLGKGMFSTELEPSESRISSSVLLDERQAETVLPCSEFSAPQQQLDQSTPPEEVPSSQPEDQVVERQVTEEVEDENSCGQNDFSPSKLLELGQSENLTSSQKQDAETLGLPSMTQGDRRLSSSQSSSDLPLRKRRRVQDDNSFDLDRALRRPAKGETAPYFPLASADDWTSSSASSTQDSSSSLLLPVESSPQAVADEAAPTTPRAQNSTARETTPDSIRVKTLYSSPFCQNYSSPPIQSSAPIQPQAAAPSTQHSLAPTTFPLFTCSPPSYPSFDSDAQPKTPITMHNLPNLINAPSPSGSASHFTTHITPSLGKLADSLPFVQYFNPIILTRDLNLLERGYWQLRIHITTAEACEHARAPPTSSQRRRVLEAYVAAPTLSQELKKFEELQKGWRGEFFWGEPNDTPMCWTEDELVRFWSDLTAYIKNGQAGFGVSAAKQAMDSREEGEEAGTKTDIVVKVFCWGELVGHVWLALFTLSQALTQEWPMEWVDSKGEVVVKMAGDRLKGGGLGVWSRKEGGVWGVVPRETKVEVEGE